MTPQLPWWRRWFGQRSERAAERYLRKKGHRVLTRNWSGPLGELDLVTRHGKTLVFVEVRSTSHEEGQSARDSVDTQKQQRLSRLAVSFMKRYRVQEVAARFDVVILAWPAGAKEPVIEHFENAFPVLGVGSMFG
ncbi:MAG: YraN family protein [Gemmatales bacterium]